MGQMMNMLQDAAACARPSGLACRRVFRSSSQILQIRTKTNGTERVPREPSGNRKWCVQLGSNDDQSCSDSDYCLKSAGSLGWGGVRDAVRTSTHGCELRCVRCQC